jgi:hypothetical protein
MNIWPIVILSLVCLAVIGLYLNAKTRARLESIRGLLDLLNIVASLGVFVSLYYTVAQFKVSQRQQEKQELQQLGQVLAALTLEFDGNLDVCRKVLAEGSNYTTAISVPENVFHCEMVKQFLTTGLLNESRLKQLVPERVQTDYISEKRVGATLWNIHHNMLLLNEVMARSTQLLTFQVLAKTDDQIRAQTDVRIKGDMAFVVQTSKKLQETLSACRPLVVELRDRCSRLAKEW